MDDIPTFKYEPLDLETDAIRLAQFKGIDEHGSPVIRLYHTTISNSRYYAVSYTWGTTAQGRPVIVNGQKLLVGRNLHELLMQMMHSNTGHYNSANENEGNLLPDIDNLKHRHATFHRLEILRHSSLDVGRTEACKSELLDGFWIDAICLDQSNSIERNHQVSQMHNIYLEADTVLTWFGISPWTPSTFKVSDIRIGSRRLLAVLCRG